MRIERALKIRDAALVALKDHFACCQHFGPTSAKLEARRLEILELKGVNRAPHWVRSYLDGAWRIMIDNAYRHDLVFGGIVDGTFYSTHSNRPDYYEKHGIAPSDYADDGRVRARGHYWRGDPTQPFFVG